MNDVCYAQSTPRSALVWTTLAFFTGFAGVSAYGPIVPKLNEQLTMGPVLMGLLAASPVFTGSLLRIPFGALVDRIGGKKPIGLLLGLSLLGIAGTAGLLVSKEAIGDHYFLLLLLLGALCGSGIAVFSVGIPTISYWYSQSRQGTALGAYAGLGNLAPGLFAFILPLVVQELGFFPAYAVWFAFVFLVLICFLAFMKDAPYFQYRQMGIPADQSTLSSACGEELFPSGKSMASMKKASTDRNTWGLTCFYFVSFGGFVALTVWFPTYWKAHLELSLIQAGLLTAVYSLSSSVIRVFGGFVSDKLGGERVCGGAFVVLTVGSLTMLLTGKSLAAAVVGSLVIALGMGFANAAVFKLVPKFMPQNIGGAAGIVGGIGAFGGFVIPVLMGYVVDLFGPVGYSLGFCIFTFLSLGCLFIFYRMVRRGPVRAVIQESQDPNSPLPQETG